MKFAKKSLLVLSFVPLLLGSCSYRGSIKTYKNADLLLTDLITYENAFQKFDKSCIESQKKAQYSYMLYISQDGCGLCNDFAPVILQYAQDTKQLIYKIDAIKNPAELDYVAEICGQNWFQGKQIVTPTVMIVHDDSKVKEIPYTKFGNITSFTNALRNEIKFTNIYMTSKEFEYAKAVKKMKKDILYFELNMKNEVHTEIYFRAIKSLIEASNNTIVICDRETHDSVTSKVVRNTNSDNPVIEYQHTYGNISEDIDFLSKLI